MSTTLTKRSCIQYVDCCVYYRFLKSSFIATVEVKCRFCNQPEDVKKHGKCNMHQRYRFQQCRKTFQLDYLYRACNPGIKEQIVNLAMNNAGIRDTARALGVSINAVVRVLKKLSPRSVTTLQLNKPKVFLICEVDEMWSFVREKKVQRWLWYAWEPRLKRIIAHAFGDRTTETLNILLQRMENFNVAFWCTDKFSAYNILPHEKHIVGKIYTQRIERENLTLRNRLKRLNRKTLGYSKSAEMHDKVIGTFIERQYYL